jgi:hypothetical protein
LAPIDAGSTIVAAARSVSRLGIDFGNTHTVAVLGDANGRTEPLMFDASFLLPSDVFAGTDGELLTGRDAQRHGKADPARLEPNPKRRIDDGAVLLVGPAGHRDPAGVRRVRGRAGRRRVRHRRP